MVNNNIRPAREEDIKAILDIQSSWDLNNVTDPAEGFLIHLFNSDDLLKYIQCGQKHIYVYDDGRLKGYLAAHQDEREIFIKHLAKKKGEPGIVPVRLEQAVFDYAKCRSFVTIKGNISLYPFFNKASYRFNTNMGWMMEGTYKDEREIVWGKFKKCLA